MKPIQLSPEQLQALEAYSEAHVLGSSGKEADLYKRSLVLAFIRICDADGTLDQFGRYLFRAGAQMLGEAMKRDDASRAQAATVI